MLPTQPTPIAPAAAPDGARNFFPARFSAEAFMGLPFTLILLSLLVQPLIYFLMAHALGAAWSVNLDQRVDQAMAALRAPALIHPALWITFLGGPIMVTTVTLIMLISLWLRQQSSYILPLSVAVTGCGLYTLLGKALFPRIRPPDAVYTTEASLSFPSGHAAQAITAYGFILYFLWRTRKTRGGRVLLLLSGSLVIAAIIFSRIYLSVHYLSDVGSGVLMGSAWLAIGIAISRWRFAHVAREEPEGFRPLTVRAALGALLAVELALYLFTGSRFIAAALPHGVAAALQTSDVHRYPPPRASGLQGES